MTCDLSVHPKTYDNFFFDRCIVQCIVNKDQNNTSKKGIRDKPCKTRNCNGFPVMWKLLKCFSRDQNNIKYKMYSAIYELWVWPWKWQRGSPSPKAALNKLLPVQTNECF